jgi:hypothetical protein
MEIDRDQLQKDIHELYAREHAALGVKGTLEMLEKARGWNILSELTATLSAGGVAVFPHAGVADCGHQIAAAVHACLDSGAEKVVFISVLHAFTDEMHAARVDVAHGGSAAKWRFWGIQGTGLDGPRQEWQRDHSPMSFRHFWAAEIKRRGIKGPKVFERYPYLVGGQPDILPGIDELAQLCEDAVVVSTADSFHHGIGYGDSPEKSFYPHEGGLELAKNTIEEGMSILGRGDYLGYNQHCVVAKSDARDAGQVFRYIRGPMTGRILEMTHSDATQLYKSSPPTWVAAALMQWQPA